MQFDSSQIGQMLGNPMSPKYESITLPIEIKSGRPWLGAIIVLWFGIVWNFMLYQAFWDKFIESGMESLFPHISFILVGVGLMVFAVYILILRTTIVIDDKMAIYNRRGLFRTRSWQQPLSRYQGILQESLSESKHTLYRVVLEHDDKSKRLVLRESYSEQRQREYWEAYAKLLNLPAIELSEMGYIERNPEDLDKTVKDLVREGKVEIDESALNERPKGVTVARMDEFITITFDKPDLKGAWIGLLLVAAFASIFIGVGLFADGAPIVFALAGFGFIGVAAGCLILEKIATRQLRISREELKFVWLTKWGEWIDGSFTAAEIETVRIEPKGKSGSVVLVESDDKKKTIGHMLGDDGVKWLCNQILSIIAR